MLCKVREHKKAYEHLPNIISLKNKNLKQENLKKKIRAPLCRLIIIRKEFKDIKNF